MGMVVIIPCYCLLMVRINRDAVSGGYLATSVDTFFFYESIVPEIGDECSYVFICDI